MKIETTRRKVHIEIIDHTRVRITDAIRQKTFNMGEMLANNLKINLLTLELSSDASRFVASVADGEGKVGSPYMLYIHLYNPSSSYGYGIVDRFWIGQKQEGVVEVTVVEENG